MSSPSPTQHFASVNRNAPAGLSHRTSCIFTPFLIALLFAATFVDRARGADDAARREGQRLVAAAAQAAIAGNNAHYLSFLHEALRRDPGNELARWQLGEVRLDDKWLTVEEAQRRAAADPRQAEYCKLRAAAAQNVQDQLELARWCRKSKLADEAKFHFSTALSLDPKNEEALRSLDMRWKGGQLVNRDESTQHKKGVQ
jgi:tetratricopeptide (TPR) repeat protein